jgi:hypothetical protein
MKKLLLSSSLLFSAFVGTSPLGLVWGAAYDCEPDPGSDTLVEYGDTVSCVFDFGGDTDVLRFVGNAGDQPFLRLSYTRNASDIYLYDPQGRLVAKSASAVPTISGVALPQDGLYTIVASATQTTGGSYTLELPCISGPCTINAPPNTVTDDYLGELCWESTEDGGFEPTGLIRLHVYRHEGGDYSLRGTMEDYALSVVSSVNGNAAVVPVGSMADPMVSVTLHGSSSAEVDLINMMLDLATLDGSNSGVAFQTTPRLATQTTRA